MEKQTRDDYNFVLMVNNQDYHDSSQETQILLSRLVHKAENALRQERCEPEKQIHILLGKCYFYQKEYEQSLLTFSSIIEKFPNDTNLAPIYLWMAKNNLLLDRLDETQSCLEKIASIVNTDDTTSVFVKQWVETMADYYIRKDEYTSAVLYLERLLEKHKTDKYQRGRILFILGQIYQLEGKSQMAISQYSKVITLNLNSVITSYAKVRKYECENWQLQQLSVVSQKENEENIVNFEPTTIESKHDSSIFNLFYPYYFSDPATKFFLEENLQDDSYYEDENYNDYDTTMLSDEMLEKMLENWDSVSIHIKKKDFKTLRDTIHLPLFDQIEGYELPYFGELISPFGWRRYRYHYGIDTRNQYGEPIYCVFDGVVRIAQRNRTYGNVIVVRHKNGLETFYAHCSRLLVKPNQEVKAGDIIALIGSTGRSTGPHLHFETRYQGNPFDPEYLIDFKGKKLRSDTLRITKELFDYMRPYRDRGKASTSSASANSGGAVYHRVRSGETLSHIARKYRTSVANIKRLNGLKSDMIREGKTLRIK